MKGAPICKLNQWLLLSRHPTNQLRRISRWRLANQQRMILRSTSFFFKKKCTFYLLAPTKETTFKAHYAFELCLIINLM
jgi:hypothetical protein